MNYPKKENKGSEQDNEKNKLYEYKKKLSEVNREIENKSNFKMVKIEENKASIKLTEIQVIDQI